MTFKIIKAHISEKDKMYYEKMHPGWKVKTKNLMLKVSFDDGSSTAYVIFEGPWTKLHMCRDCGSYYEFSTCKTFHKLDKSIYGG